MCKGGQLGLQLQHESTTTSTWWPPDLHIVAKPPKKLKIPFWDFSYDVKKERKKKD